jgi:hypothetical protein
LDVLECDINVENYPRVMYEAGRQKKIEPHQHQVGKYQEGAGQPHDRGGERGDMRGGRYDRPEATRRTKVGGNNIPRRDRDGRRKAISGVIEEAMDKPKRQGIWGMKCN